MSNPTSYSNLQLRYLTAATGRATGATEMVPAPSLVAPPIPMIVDPFGRGCHNPTRTDLDAASIHDAAPPPLPPPPPTTTTTTTEPSSSPLRTFKKPTDNDVLCGRGNAVQQHYGNVQYRDIIKKYFIPYLKVDKAEKIDVAHMVLKEVYSKERNPPGRFVKYDPKISSWYEISRKDALAKVRQALREGASTARLLEQETHFIEDKYPLPLSQQGNTNTNTNTNTTTLGEPIKVGTKGRSVSQKKQKKETQSSASSNSTQAQKRNVTEEEEKEDSQQLSGTNLSRKIPSEDRSENQNKHQIIDDINALVVEHPLDSSSKEDVPKETNTSEERSTLIEKLRKLYNSHPARSLQTTSTESTVGNKNEVVSTSLSVDSDELSSSDDEIYHTAMKSRLTKRKSDECVDKEKYQQLKETSANDFNASKKKRQDECLDNLTSLQKPKNYNSVVKVEEEIGKINSLVNSNTCTKCKGTGKVNESQIKDETYYEQIEGVISNEIQKAETKYYVTPTPSQTYPQRFNVIQKKVMEERKSENDISNHEPILSTSLETSEQSTKTILNYIVEVERNWGISGTKDLSILQRMRLIEETTATYRVKLNRFL